MEEKSLSVGDDEGNARVSVGDEKKIGGGENDVKVQKAA